MNLDTINSCTNKESPLSVGFAATSPHKWGEVKPIKFLYFSLELPENSTNAEEFNLAPLGRGGGEADGEGQR